MARRKKGLPLHGWLVIDKPRGPSSTQIVGKIRRLTNAMKTGHGGTLDPMATGVLTLAFGEATKTSGWQLESDKAYEFVISWGQSTDSLDAEGSITEESDDRPESRSQIEDILDQFRGPISQMPPAYSALKVDGRRAYDLARAGEEVVLQPRNITIYRLEILDHNPAETRFLVECSKGSYVRSLARDIAAAIGIPGHVTVLHRTKSGPFTLDQAISPEHLEEQLTTAPAEDILLPVDTAILDMPLITINDSDAQRLRQGQKLQLSAAQAAEFDGALVRISCDNHLVAIADIDQGTTVIRRIILPH